LYFHGPALILAALMFIGWVGTIAFPLFMGVIPAETLPAHHVAKGMGLVICVGEILGGFIAPLLGGKAADMTTLAAPIQIATVCAFGAVIFSLFLKETAPVKTGITTAEPEPTAL
jgi:ACS family hexuronate transporter-like MFS transporter